MELDYTNSASDQVAHFEALHPSAFSRLAFQHYSWVAYWGVMAALGIYVSVFAELIFMAALFAAMYVFYLCRAVPYSRVLAGSSAPGTYAEVNRVHLRVDDDGLHETIAGQVQSFAPWAAFQRFIVTEDHVLIELAANLWANVPRRSVVQGAAACEELVSVLRARNVPEQVPGKVAVKPAS